MKSDKSIKQVKAENVDIKRIVSGGGILWEKIFRWKKYNVATDLIGYFNSEIPEKEMLSKYPQYVYIVFYKTDYGNYEAYGYSPISSEILVESENRNAYPVRGIVGRDYYELID